MSDSANRQLYIILSLVLLGFVGNSIAFPIFAPLFLHPAYGDIVPYQWGEHVRSIFLGITLMTYPIGQFIGSPILGALSDRHGRKNILLISAWSQTCFYLLTAFSLTYNLLWLLILSRFLTGCSEGNISIARSMVVDNKDLNRHKSLGLISAISAVGYILGPLIGGVLADRRLVSWFNFSVPFYVAALLSLIIIILASLYLQESLIQRYHSGINFLKQFNIFARVKSLCQNKTLKILLFTSSIASLSYDTYYEFYPAYLTGLWHANPLQIAWYTLLLSAAIAFSCGWLSPTLAHYFKNRKLIIYSMLVIAAVLIVLLIPPVSWMVMIFFILIGIAIGVSSTNYTLQISEAAESHLQGEVFGTLWGIRMLLDGTISIIGGLLLVIAYRLPIAVAASMALIGWVIYCFWDPSVDSSE